MKNHKHNLPISPKIYSIHLCSSTYQLNTPPKWSWIRFSDLIAEQPLHEFTHTPSKDRVQWSLPGRGCQHYQGWVWQLPQVHGPSDSSQFPVVLKHQEVPREGSLEGGHWLILLVQVALFQGPGRLSKMPFSLLLSPLLPSIHKLRWPRDSLVYSCALWPLCEFIL